MCFTLICYEEVGGILEDVSLFCPAIACWPHLMQNECLQARRDCYGRERRQALLSLPRFGSHLNLKECLHPGGIQKTRCPFQGVPLCTQSSLSGVGPPISALQLRARHSPELPVSVLCCAPWVFTYVQQHFFSSAFKRTPLALQKLLCNSSTAKVRPHLFCHIPALRRLWVVTAALGKHAVSC